MAILSPHRGTSSSIKNKTGSGSSRSHSSAGGTGVSRVHSYGYGDKTVRVGVCMQKLTTFRNAEENDSVIG